MTAENGSRLESHDLVRVEAKVDALTEQVAELVTAWNTARGMVRFVKYLSATVTTVSTAVGAVWALLHFGGTK